MYGPFTKVAKRPSYLIPPSWPILHFRPGETKSRMAARRLSKSAVDWVKFEAGVPKTQIPCFKALKAKSDMFASRYDIHVSGKVTSVTVEYVTRVCQGRSRS